MIVRVSIHNAWSFHHMRKFVFPVAIKNFHCASVVNAEGDAAEPRLTLKQIERKKLEKRSKFSIEK